MDNTKNHGNLLDKTKQRGKGSRDYQKFVKKLMARLRNELASHSRGVNDTTECGVYVMITRACLYTPEDMDIA